MPTRPLSENHLRTILLSVGKGTVGVGGAATAILSTIESFSNGIKLAGIVVGLLVAIATLLSVFFDVLRKYREARQWEYDHPQHAPRKSHDETAD